MVQNPKEGGAAAPVGTRKTSLSYSATGNTSRPGTRRRDTSDSFNANGPMSPAEPKTFFRGESSAATPPPALLRRRTDFKEEDSGANVKDSTPAKDEEDSQPPFGSTRRVGTGPLSAGLNSPANSPWSAGPNTSAFGSMGSFGSFNAPTGTGQEKIEQRPGFGSARGASRFKDLLAKSSSEDIQSAAKEKAAFGGLSKLPEEDGDTSRNAARDALRNRPNRSETNPYEEEPLRTGSAALGSQEGNHGPEPIGFGSIGRSHGGLNDPISPAHTNPYQSPYGAQRDDGQDGDGQPYPPFSATRRNLFSEDGGQRSASGFPGFPGFGSGPAGPANWSSAGLASGTPARDRGMGFGDAIFSPLSEMQSPGAGLGASFFNSGFGSMGRGSRLGNILPSGMQDPMRDDFRNESRGFDRPDSSAYGVRDPFDNGFARASGAFEDGGAPGPRPDNSSPSYTQQAEDSQTGAGQPASTGSDFTQQTSLPGSADNNNQMPTAQQRQMVMPDRMRWIYRDPQGATQGPWSGLEMHDWFKAGFFTAELLVKKVEDAEFEPLAQLVRRIGNSREPFLVPQIGVPHGPAPSGAQTAWPNAAPPVGNAQPPFASAFPSFGTTLTAEQQNALERRKQEEQYLMARQKEHLAQQQMMAKQIGMQPPSHGMHSLQHHSSAHSLHSQPSYGSITSPGGGFHTSPLPPGAPQNVSHAPIGQPPFNREDELPGLDRLNLGQRGGPLGAPGDGSPGSQQVNQMLQDRARLQQQPMDMRGHQEAFLGQQGRNERLEEFQELRGQPEAIRPGPDNILAPIGAHRPLEDQIEAKPTPIGHATTKAVSEHPSLTEQVQWTTAKQQEQPTQAPAPSISPLPAPAAQRNRQHVAESLAVESRSQSQTPVETPATSVAPWAERPVDLHRGPSLREIQEAEARKATEQAALLEAARRAQAEQDRLAETTTTIIPPAPGLPATATWGTSSSPGTPTATPGSVWAKQSAKTGPTASASAKKTLAQIQKEEEARKQRATVAAAAQAQAQAASSPVSALQGKRYAELASKAVPAVPASMTSSAWTTVGSSGKVKPPPTIIATPQAMPRTVSSTVSPALKSRPSLPATRSSTMNSGEKNKAQEEFVKWLKGQLGNRLNSGINGKTFVSPYSHNED